MLDRQEAAAASAAASDLAYVDELDCGTIAASRQVYGRGLILYGWAICESTGAGAAKVRLRDGRDTGGSVLAPIALVASASQLNPSTSPGVRCTTGLYVEVVAGSVELVLYVGPLPD